MRVLSCLADTEHLSRALAHCLCACPQVRAVLLRGVLGSGKTTFTRALVHALPGGHHAEVASPSFTLCHEYPTTPPIVHGDLYRVPYTLPDELWDALENPHVLTMIEWAEYLPLHVLPQEYLDIVFETCQEKRIVTVTPHGTAARRLVQALKTSNAPVKQ